MLRVLTGSHVGTRSAFAQAQKPARVDDAALRSAALSKGEDWLSYGFTPKETRYSPLSQINASNVSRLGLAWSFDVGPGGGGQEQVTDDDFNNWFPHIAPDGRSMVFLSYEKDVAGHPENQDVTLRQMNLQDRKVRVLARLFGGQGTVNVPCWSPDGKKIAFVTYQLILDSGLAPARP